MFRLRLVRIFLFGIGAFLAVLHHACIGDTSRQIVGTHPVWIPFCIFRQDESLYPPHMIPK